MNYTCPVCGYNRLPYPPADFHICPSCGTEFGNDDFDTTHEELRRQWIDGRARWWSRNVSQPDDWDPVTQLRNIGYEVTKSDLEAIGLYIQASVGKFDLPESQEVTFQVTIQDRVSVKVPKRPQWLADFAGKTGVKGYTATKWPAPKWGSFSSSGAANQPAVAQGV